MHADSNRLNTADDWIIYLAFLLQNGSGDWILDGDEGRVGHGPRGEGGMAHPGPLDPPLCERDVCVLQPRK